MVENTCQFADALCRNINVVITGVLSITAAILGGIVGVYLKHRLERRKLMQFEPMITTEAGKPALQKNGEMMVRIFNPNKIALTICNFYALTDKDPNTKRVVYCKRIPNERWNKEPIVIKEWDIGEYVFIGLLEECRGSELPNRLYGFHEQRVDLYYHDIKGSHKIASFISTYTKP